VKFHFLTPWSTSSEAAAELDVQVQFGNVSTPTFGTPSP
jgi:hypothetical protein